MAIGFEIPGKCLLKSGSNVIGMTDDQDVIRVSEMIGERVIHSNESGPHVPAKVINLGRYMVIRARLTQWDNTVLDALMKASGASSLGQLGTLGADVELFAISIVPAVTGARQYSFPKCRFVDQFEIGGFGIMEKSQGLVIQAIPDLAALSTATTAIYTTAAIS